MDTRLSKIREEDIRSIALDTSRVLDVQIISSRFSGVRECFEIMLTLPADLTIQESDEIISAIKLKLGDYIRCTFLCTSKD
jgi:divalent metal cation (Fe/Co/Zn/Cd) transporter